MLIDTLRTTLVDEGGMEDEFSEVKITSEALILSGYMLPDNIGIPWAELAHVLQHPYVQEKLEEVELLAGHSIV